MWRGSVVIEVQVYQCFLQFLEIVGVDVFWLSLRSAETADAHSCAFSTLCFAGKTLDPLGESVLNHEAGSVVFPATVPIVQDLVVCGDTV